MSVAKLPESKDVPAVCAERGVGNGVPPRVRSGAGGDRRRLPCIAQAVGAAAGVAFSPWEGVKHTASPATAREERNSP